ncbi:MAG: hypothetical protein U5N58_00400 [Actinomycetota bacterium]|nr:hypothetical protein [Actinomycetota bacterium]
MKMHTYISNILNVKDDLENISPIVMTQQSIRQGLKDHEFSKGFLGPHRTSHIRKLGQNKDLVMPAGAKSAEDGYFMGVSSRGDM